MLKETGAQNIPACENQGKQLELSDHWKSIKKVVFEKNDAIKTKRLTEIQVLTKEFTKRLEENESNADNKTNQLLRDRC